MTRLSAPIGCDSKTTALEEGIGAESGIIGNKQVVAWKTGEGISANHSMEWRERAPLNENRVHMELEPCQYDTSCSLS